MGCILGILLCPDRVLTAFGFFVDGVPVVFCVPVSPHVVGGAVCVHVSTQKNDACDVSSMR